MDRHLMTYRGVKVDEMGNRYLDVSSDAADTAGLSVLVPLVVFRNGEPNSATSSVENASSAVTTPTASDLREVLCAADAILLDSSTDETSRMKASSSSSMRGLASRTGSGNASFQSPAMFNLHLAACIAVMILSLADFWWRSLPVAIACVAASALLVWIAFRWHLDERG